jgi:hypothetical protein
LLLLYSNEKYLHCVQLCLEVWGTEYEKIKATCIRAEKLGFYGFYYGESFADIDCWTIISALVPQTNRIKLGPVITYLLQLLYTDILEGNDKSPGYIAAINALTINESNRLRIQNQKLQEADKSELQGVKSQIDKMQQQQSMLQKLLLTSFAKLNRHQGNRPYMNLFVREMAEDGLIDDNAAKSWLAGEEQEYGKLHQRVKGGEEYEQLRQRITSIHNNDSVSMTLEQKQQAIQRLIRKCEHGTIRALHADNLITEEQYIQWQNKLVSF